MAVELNWTDIGSRVREARLAAGLSQDQLADLIGLDRTMVSKVEAGTRRLDALELVRLSQALELPIGHFLDPAPEIISRRASLADDTATDASRSSYRMDALLSAWFRDIRLLMSLGTFRPSVPLRYPGRARDQEGARAAARWIRSQLQLGDEPIDSMADICERCGQLILITDLPGEGASATDGDIAAAVVSRFGDPGRRRATAAHELGHMVLGDEYSTDLGVSSSRESREAVIDAFAAELLLPQAVISSSLGETEHVRSTLVGLAARYRTSWSLALRQAKAADMLDQLQLDRLRNCLPTRAEFMDTLGWTPQPDLASITVPPRFAHAVIQAYRKGLITDARAIELMHGQLTDKSDLPPLPDEDLNP
ncbi:ImmA/IrrE family metallo-endopeptidase [Streptosporangiaceae bacterium NEAU-GS5]|nr:ImmA/IrrE family metallo-endopeptidase [Streptosporangiaceae bacterium NEAU-GS5]